MTTNPARPAEPGDPRRRAGDTQSGHPQARQHGGKANTPAPPPSPAPSHAADEAGRGRSERAAPAGQAGRGVTQSGAVLTTSKVINIRKADRGELPTLRGGAFSTNQLSPEDWHDTRATNDDDTLRRSLIWSWSKTLQRLVILSGGAMSYVGAVVMVLLLVPDATPLDAMRIAGAAVAAGSGGLAVNAVAQRLRQRRREVRTDERDRPADPAADVGAAGTARARRRGRPAAR